MLKNRRKIILSLTCIVILFFVGYRIFNKNNNNITVTETVIANAKSEKVSMPYINPEWEEYMKLSEEEKEKVEETPQMYIYNYIPEDNLYGDYNELPSSYNLRDEYPTQLYNQGSEGLCWAYATSTMLESNLKVTQGIDVQFSIEQLDYLSADSQYYKNEYNPYSLGRKLHGGMPYVADTGYFNSLLASGVTPVVKEKFSIDENAELDVSEIANNKNVDYTIISGVCFPKYENTEEYRNMLKSFIKNYGAVHIGTVSPKMYSNNIIDFKYDNKGFDALVGMGHAMVLIGWDDNYDTNSDGIADGVWILQNSWNELSYDTYYITYSSSIQSLYGIKEIKNKNWDNNYDMADSPNIEYKGIVLHQANSEYKGYDKILTDFQKENSLYNRNAISGTLMVTYNKPKFKKEKLNAINFNSASQNSNYKIYISEGGNKDNFKYIKDINTDLPGLYTVYFDDIILDNDKFIIKIESSNGAIYTQVNAFTSDVSVENNDKNISSYVYDGGFNLKQNYQYNVISYVQNISDGEKIEYKLYDEDGNDIENDYTKVVTINESKAIGKVEFSRKTQLYTKVYIDIIHNNQTIETIEIIYNPKTDLGGMIRKGNYRRTIYYNKC